MTKTTDANDRMNRPLDAVDPQIADLLRDEAKRQATGSGTHSFGESRFRSGPRSHGLSLHE